MNNNLNECSSDYLSTKVAEEVVSIQIYPELTDEQKNYVIRIIKNN